MLDRGEVERIYDAAGAGEDLWQDMHPGEHVFADNKAYEFFGIPVRSAVGPEAPVGKLHAGSRSAARRTGTTGAETTAKTNMRGGTTYGGRSGGRRRRLVRGAIAVTLQ